MHPRPVFNSVAIHLNGTAASAHNRCAILILPTRPDAAIHGLIKHISIVGALRPGHGLRFSATPYQCQ
jgi:hypothetical protein